MLERHLQQSVLGYLRKLSRDDPSIVFRKRHGTVMGVAGDPDIYLLYKGRHAEIELKLPGNSPTTLQQVRLAEWGRAGALVGVVHSVTELRKLLSEVDN